LGLVAVVADLLPRAWNPQAANAAAFTGA
jgi:hypothetical protein